MSTNRYEQARRHENYPLPAQDGNHERSRVIELALIALSSALLYLSALSLPYSLGRLHTYVHLDLERFQIGSQRVDWPLLAALVLEGGLYWMACLATRQAQGKAAWAVVLGGAALSAVALLPFYPLGSTDIFDYIMHGRMTGLYGANPFVQLASQYRTDTFAYYAGWPNAPSAYGPLWEVLAGLVARLPGNGVISNVIAFKLLEGVFLAGTATAVALILRRVAPRRALTGVLLLTWNPILLYETMGNGHNDIAMAFCIALAVLAILYRHFTAGVLALVAGALIKFIPVLMVPAAGLIALRELPDTRARARFLLLTAPTAAALIVLAYAPFWDGLAGAEHRPASRAFHQLVAHHDRVSAGPQDRPGDGQVNHQRGGRRPDHALLSVRRFARLARPDVVELCPLGIPHLHVLPFVHSPLAVALVLGLAAGAGSHSADRRSDPDGAGVGLWPHAASLHLRRAGDRPPGSDGSGPGDATQRWSFGPARPCRRLPAARMGRL